MPRRGDVARLLRSVRDGVTVGARKWDAPFFENFSSPPRVLELIDGTKIGM